MEPAQQTPISVLTEVCERQHSDPEQVDPSAGRPPAQLLALAAVWVRAGRGGKAPPARLLLWGALRSRSSTRPWAWMALALAGSWLGIRLRALFDLDAPALACAPASRREAVQPTTLAADRRGC